MSRRRALSEIEITPLRRRHLRRVLAIERAVYPRPWTAGLFASELSQPDTRAYLVALSPTSRLEDVRTAWPVRTVVGYGGILVQVGEAHVTTLAVHPAHHRRKVASRLLLALLREARARDAGAATLEVRAANHGAQRLYGAFGFVPAGVRPRYYAETGEDAVIMWLHDLKSDEVTARWEAIEARLDEPGGSSGAPDFVVPWVQGRVGLPGEPVIRAPGNLPGRTPGPAPGRTTERR